MRRHLVLVAAFVTLLLTAACAPLKTTPPTKNADGYTDITAQELAEMLEKKDFVLVNVHIPYDGEIAQTDLLVPFDDVADQVDKLPDKTARVVVYCRSGSMSTEAAKMLVSLGYTDVQEVDGGMKAWRAAGHKLVSR